jgi:hypothetical protein
MIFTTEQAMTALTKLVITQKETFIEKCKNADPVFVALMETKHELHFKEEKQYPENELQFIKEFIEARKTI